VEGSSLEICTLYVEKHMVKDGGVLGNQQIPKPFARRYMIHGLYLRVWLGILFEDIYDNSIHVVSVLEKRGASVLFFQILIIYGYDMRIDEKYLLAGGGILSSECSFVRRKCRLTPHSSGIFLIRPEYSIRQKMCIIMVFGSLYYTKEMRLITDRANDLRSMWTRDMDR
jgi:hypothetical protein